MTIQSNGQKTMRREYNNKGMSGMRETKKRPKNNSKTTMKLMKKKINGGEEPNLSVYVVQYLIRQVDEISKFLQLVISILPSINLTNFENVVAHTISEINPTSGVTNIRNIYANRLDIIDLLNNKADQVDTYTGAML